MITIKNERINGGMSAPETIYDATVEKAIESLMIYEIGFGGFVKSVSETEIVTETRAFSCIDTTRFSGPESEIVVLISALHMYYSVVETAKKKIQESTIDMMVQITDEMLRRNSKQNPGRTVSPFVAVNFAGIIAGKTSVEIFSAVALGVDVDDCIKVKAKDLMTLVKIWREQDKLSFIEVAESLGCLIA